MKKFLVIIFLAIYQLGFAQSPPTYSQYVGSQVAQGYYGQPGTYAALQIQAIANLIAGNYSSEYTNNNNLISANTLYVSGAYAASVPAIADPTHPFGSITAMQASMTENSSIVISDGNFMEVNPVITNDCNIYIADGVVISNLTLAGSATNINIYGLGTIQNLYIFSYMPKVYIEGRAIGYNAGFPTLESIIISNTYPNSVLELHAKQIELVHIIPWATNQTCDFYADNFTAAFPTQVSGQLGSTNFVIRLHGKVWNCPNGALSIIAYTNFSALFDIRQITWSNTVQGRTLFSSGVSQQFVFNNCDLVGNTSIIKNGVANTTNNVYLINSRYIGTLPWGTNVFFDNTQLNAQVNWHFVGSVGSYPFVNQLG